MKHAKIRMLNERRTVSETGGVKMVTISNAIKEWLVSCKRNSVKPTTYDRLITSLGLLERYEIKDIFLHKLAKQDIQDYINELVEDAYSLSTIKKQYCLIHEYLEYALEEGYIPRPIHRSIALPIPSTVKKAKRESVGYTPEEQEKLQAVLMRNDHPTWVAARLMLETGLRVGECLALTWDDVLWQRRALRINKTLIRLNNTNVSKIQDGAKSYTSNRNVPLNEKALRLLKEFRTTFPDPCGLLFVTQNGKPMNYEMIRWQISKVCKEANVPYLGQHVFRHTFATNCYNRGCDVKILSKLLGHADVTVTYNIYIHLYGDALEEMRSVVG